ncbi:MAG: hypothetical protein AB7P22_00325 [Vicinamibacterales bacterium]
MSNVRAPRVSPIVVLGLLFLISLPAVTLRLYASDEIEYFAYLRSMWFDRDLSFDNDYRYFYDRGIPRGSRPGEDGEGSNGGDFHKTFLDTTTETGLRINFAPVGTAILWAPFYAVADIGVRVARAMGSDVAADGFSRPYLAAVAYASAVYGFLALLLAATAIRRLLGSADWSLVAVWLGTPLVFYMYVAPGFSHAASAFAVAAFVVTWLRIRETWSWRGIALLGALAGLMAMVREQDAFIAVGPALDYVVYAFQSARRGTRRLAMSVAGAAIGVATAAACFIPQLLTYRTLYGRFGPSPLVSGKMDWTAPHLWDVLASLEYGFFFWTPLALPALAGLVVLAAGLVPEDRHPGRPRQQLVWIGLLCLLMVFSQIYVSGSVSSWTGSTFGQRRLVGLTVFLAIGLASLFRLLGPRWARSAVVGLVVLCTWWNLGLVAQFGTNLMNRQRLELAVNTYHNFVTIPRMAPELAYRYFFNRESFYRASRPAAP